MKNFKLLLATTAILSTGALIVNAADGIHLTMHPMVTMVKYANASIVTHLGFGNINWEKDKIISISSSFNSDSNQLDVNVGGDALYFGGAQLGRVTVSGGAEITAGLYELSFPEEDVILYTEDERECGKITSFSQNYFAGNSSFHEPGFYVGGVFKVSELSSGGSSFPDQCTGDAQITLILKQ